MRLSFAFSLVLLTASAVAHGAMAQDAKPEVLPSPVKNAERDAPPTNPEGWSDTHMLGILPAYNVASGDTTRPLTGGEKFHIFVRGTTDPIAFSAVAVQAAISQAKNANAGFGQGASGFGKRYGAAWLDSTSGRFFRNYAYPELFRQDPRYFRVAGQDRNRTGYALTRVFVTRSDRNTTQFNWSKLCASFTSSSLSNLYYPESNRGVGLTLTNVSISYGVEAGVNVLKEFWPDLQKRFFKK